MSAPVIIASYLLAAGFCLGLLPEARRNLPALPLIFATPLILLWIAALYGLGVGLLWATAIAALYRAPLFYWARRFFWSAKGPAAGQMG